MLRAPTRISISEKIEESFFGTENYTITFPKEGNCLVRIKFIPDGRFEFSYNLFEKDNPHKDKFFTHESPGEKFLAAEVFITPRIDLMLDRLSGWTRRIREELIASNPFAREISDLRNQMDSRLADLGGKMEDFFTKSEAQELDERLSTFYSRLSELSSQNEELTSSLENLQKTVEDLRASVFVLNRGTWFRMSAGRLLTGLKNVAASKEARELALEAAKKFLLEGPK